MPIYEYVCKGCEKAFDKIVKADTPDGDVACPRCGVKDARRKLSMFSFGSRSAGGDFKASSSGGGGCSSCHSHHCSTCKC
jgi:putative FmdB family regulatory protein